MRFVLDASALLSGLDLDLDGEMVTTDGVDAEVQKGKAGRNMEYLKEKGLRVLVPENEQLAAVREAAERTGDIARLSEVDVGVLALALQVCGTILTDDYSIQNTAETMGLRYMPLGQKGISERIEWKYRCAGCGRYYETPQKDCPICGSEVRTKRR